jgi:hypothetical protein
MMDFSAINRLAVLFCVTVSMISGSLWYNPKTFFPVWWQVVGKGQTPGLQTMGMVWAITVLAAIVEAVAMAFMFNSLGSLMPGGPVLGRAQ